MNRIFSLLVTAFAFVGSASVLAQSEPAPNYKIAYNVLSDEKADDYEVFSMNADGLAKANITQNPDVAWTYYSLPGKLLFISDRGRSKFIGEFNPESRSRSTVEEVEPKIGGGVCKPYWINCLRPLSAFP